MLPVVSVRGIVVAVTSKVLKTILVHNLLEVVGAAVVISFHLLTRIREEGSHLLIEPINFKRTVSVLIYLKVLDAGKKVIVIGT